MKIRKTRSTGCASAFLVPSGVLLSLLAASSTISSATASWAGSSLNGADQIPLISSASINRPQTPLTPPARDHDFTLRHIFHHGTHEYPNVHVRMDVRPNDNVWVTSDENGGTKSLGKLHARSIPEPIERLVDRTVARMQTMYDEARIKGSAATLDQSSWTIDEVMGPNVTDKETVLTLAKMSSNAYTREPGTGEWQDVNGGFNHSQGFGWEGDGLRGHIFADTDNATIVISLKGTSPAVFDGAETTTNDKVNDNLFFGCCCGQGGQYLWHQVCDCMTSAYTCNQTCLVKALKEKNRYYGAAIELYGNVTELYPQSTVWLAGHSLGGSTSALLGLTFGIPVTTFEAPGDALAAARLGLPSPPSAHPSAPQRRKYTGATHFGHTADPIFMGSCNAATSGCTLGGYALQTECHTGRVCRYDTVEDKGWRVGIGYHKILSVIQDVIEIYDKVATCVPDDECVDCFNWKYFESNGSSPTTSRSSSSSSTTSASTSLTRTTTCQTPGWWGCLDESTTSNPTSTTTSSTSTSTKSSPTTSCVEYGWFGGCLETTTFTPTSAAPTTSPSTKLTDPLTTSCVEYGWFGGCLESTTLTATPTSLSSTLKDSLTTSCAQYGWFDDCIEIITLSCAQYGWFGGCVESVTLLPTVTAAAPAATVAVVPTVTTTRPVSVASGVR